MAKRQWQQGILLFTHPDENGNVQYILISKKTGFQDVTINGKRYYHVDGIRKASDIDFAKIAKEHSGVKDKQHIVVRRTKPYASW